MITYNKFSYIVYVEYILSSPSTATVKPEQKLLTQWNRYGNSAIGRRLFSWKVSRAAPYSGSIKAQIVSLKAGSALVSIQDRRSIRNHLNSIHAIALTNLGELASGLAMLAALPMNIRAIVVKLEIEYIKKARGKLIAEGSASPPKSITEPFVSLAIATIKDNSGDTVALVSVSWLLSPKEVRDIKKQEAQSK